MATLVQSGGDHHTSCSARERPRWFRAARFVCLFGDPNRRRFDLRRSGGLSNADRSYQANTLVLRVTRVARVGARAGR